MIYGVSIEPRRRTSRSLFNNDTNTRTFDMAATAAITPSTTVARPPTTAAEPPVMATALSSLVL
jgi:hypothetical protein